MYSIKIEADTAHALRDKIIGLAEVIAPQPKAESDTDRPRRGRPPKVRPVEAAVSATDPEVEQAMAEGAALSAAAFEATVAALEATQAAPTQDVPTQDVPTQATPTQATPTQDVPVVDQRSNEELLVAARAALGKLIKAGARDKVTEVLGGYDKLSSVPVDLLPALVAHAEQEASHV